MNSRNWTFVGPKGYTCRIALKHGVNSGNLIIFCNSKIILIDYDVFEDKDYSFFIEEEFCKIHLRKKKKGFVYEFEVSEEVDTPLNRKRQEYYRHQLIDTAKKALLAMSIIIFIVFAGYIYRNFLKVQNLRDFPLVTEVTLRHILDGDKHNARYNFFYRNRNFNKDKLKLDQLPDGTILAGNGMPLENYDKFHIVFYYIKPYNNRIEYDKPPFFQLSKYRDRLSNKIRMQDPSASEEKCNCIFKAVLEEAGVEGFANVYFQTATREQNPYNNKGTYERMIKKKGLAEKLKQCK